MNQLVFAHDVDAVRQSKRNTSKTNQKTNYLQQYRAPNKTNNCPIKKKTKACTKPAKHCQSQIKK